MDTQNPGLGRKKSRGLCSVQKQTSGLCRAKRRHDEKAIGDLKNDISPADELLDHPENPLAEETCSYFRSLHESHNYLAPTGCLDLDF